MPCAQDHQRLSLAHARQPSVAGGAATANARRDTGMAGRSGRRDRANAGHASNSQTHKLGLDFAPSYGAAQAVLNHRSIYSVADFVYPPLAAVAWTPIALLSYRVAIVLVAFAEVVSLVFVVTAALRLSTKSQWWPVLAGLFSAALLSSDLVTKSLWLENL
jgi:hypothetical protein